MLNKKKFTQAQFISYAGILSALAIVLLYLEIPYPFADYLKLDLSEVIILIAATMNIWLAITVAIVKVILGFLLPPTSTFIGYVAMLIGSLTIIISYCSCSKVMSKIPSLVVTSLIFSIVMVLCNYTFVTPFYFGVSFADAISQTYSLPIKEGSEFSFLMYNIVLYLPFNLIKMGVVSTVFYFVSNRLSKD